LAPFCPRAILFRPLMGESRNSPFNNIVVSIVPIYSPFFFSILPEFGLVLSSPRYFSVSHPPPTPPFFSRCSRVYWLFSYSFFKSSDVPVLRLYPLFLGLGRYPPGTFLHKDPHRRLSNVRILIQFFFYTSLPPFLPGRCFFLPAPLFLKLIVFSF